MEGETGHGNDDQEDNGEGRGGHVLMCSPGSMWGKDTGEGGHGGSMLEGGGH